MEITINGHEVLFKCEILSISHSPINIYSSRYDSWAQDDDEKLLSQIYEEKSLKVILHVACENEKWEIPFNIGLLKSLKYDFWEEFADKPINFSVLFSPDNYPHYESTDNNMFNYSKKISIDVPLHKLLKSNISYELINLFYYLDTGVSNLDISKSSYEIIDSKLILEEIYPDVLSPKYFIRSVYFNSNIFHDIDTHIFIHSEIPSIDFNLINIDSVVVSKKSFFGRKHIYMILPCGYSSSYKSNCSQTTITSKEVNLNYSDVFVGSYKECLNKLENGGFSKNSKFKKQLGREFRIWKKELQKIKNK